MAKKYELSGTAPLLSLTLTPFSGYCTYCKDNVVENTSFCSDHCLRNYRKIFNAYKPPFFKAEQPNKRAVRIQGTHQHEGTNRIYNIQRVDFSAGAYSSRKINTQAWKAFQLSWSDYLDKIVMPLATEKDKGRIERLKRLKTPPKRRHDLTKVFPAFKTQCRIFYLSFNIIDNCIALNIAFPRNVCILPSDVGYFNQSKNQNSLRKTFLEGRSERLDRRVCLTPKQMHEEKMVRSTKRRLDDSLRHAATQRRDTYNQWILDEKRHYLNTRKYLDAHTKLWNPNYEELVHIPELGCSGTLNHSTAFTIHRYFREIAITNGVTYTNKGGRTVTCGDAGMSCQDQMRNNRITFPHANIYGFEMQNLKQYGMSNQNKINLGWQEFDILLSTFNKDKVSISPIGCAYNVMLSDQSRSKTFPKFLSTPCQAGNDCTKDVNLYRLHNDNHFCSTCGFNSPEYMKSFCGNSLHFYTWFSKSWSDEDKENHYKMIGPTSSTIDVLFVGDEDNKDSAKWVLEKLNGQTISYENKWHLARSGFKCVLKGGGTTFTGFIYARNYVVTDEVSTHRKIAEHVMKDKQVFDFCSNPDYSSSNLLLMFCKLREVHQIALAERSVQWEMVKRGAWENYSGVPDPGSLCNFLYAESAANKCQVADIIMDCIKAHCSTFRESYCFRETGVHNRGTYTNSIDIEQLSTDISALVSFVQDGQIIYSDKEMMCESCNRCGTVAEICKHVENNPNCNHSTIYFVEKTTIEKMQEQFEEKILAFAKLEQTKRNLENNYQALGREFKERLTRLDCRKAPGPDAPGPAAPGPAAPGPAAPAPTIIQNSLARLKDKNGWLDDVAINTVQSVFPRSPNVIVLNSLLAAKQTNDGMERVFRKKTITRTSRIVLPVNIDQLHWVVCAFDLATGQRYLMDSLNRNGTRSAAHVTAEFETKVLQACATLFQGWSTKTWTTTVLQVPQQPNSNDCGVFALKFIEAICTVEANVPLTEQLFESISNEPMALKTYRSTFCQHFERLNGEKVARPIPQHQKRGRCAGPGATGLEAAGPEAAGPGATGPEVAGPGATGPGATEATGPGATGPGATGSGPRQGAMAAGASPTGNIGNSEILESHREFLENLDMDALDEAAKIRLIVLKVVEIFSNKFDGMTDEDAYREYLHRIKYNITTANFKLYSRWNRLYKAQRTYKNHWEFDIAGMTYRVPLSTVRTDNDKDKRIALLLRAYAEGMPKAKVVDCGDGVDAVIADSYEKCIKYRLQTVLRNTIRAARFHNHNYKLIIGKKFDGAPFNKTGADTAQTVVLAHIANEHFSVTIETLLLCGIINATEDSKATKNMCLMLDKSMAAFQKMVEERAGTDDPYRVEGFRINSVDILLTMDLKAVNKVVGAGGHASTFYGVSHIGISNVCTGLGNRHQTEKKLFSDYHRCAEDKEKDWKPGAKPIKVDHGERKRLREDIERLLYSKGKGRVTDHRYRHSREKWEKEAMKEAKKRGHSFVYEEYFPKTKFAAVCYCPLHYKTVKVLDILMLMMLSLTSYDRYCGRLDAIGPALDHFLNELNNKAFKSQLTSFAADARKMWTKLRLKQGLCHSGNGLKVLNSLVAKEDKINVRLLGRQANVVLNNLKLFDDIMLSARAQINHHSYKSTVAKRINRHMTKEKLDAKMVTVQSAIMAYLLAIRNSVYWSSRSGLSVYKKGTRFEHEDYLKYVDQVTSKLLSATKVLDMLQSNLFPDLVRPYDICITFCLPDVAEDLKEIGILQGYEGLLEQSEKYHSWLNRMPAFKMSKSFAKRRKLFVDGVVSYEKSRTQESRNVYRFGRAWLVNCYFYSQPYGVVKETRKKTAPTRSDIVPLEDFPYIDSDESCPCGAAKVGRDCEFCSRGEILNMFELANETLKYVGINLSESSIEYRNKSTVALRAIASQRFRHEPNTNANILTRQQLIDKLLITRNIFQKWVLYRKDQFIRGLKVRPTY
jgi:hypothetical protein